MKATTRVTDLVCWTPVPLTRPCTLPPASRIRTGTQTRPAFQARVRFFSRRLLADPHAQAREAADWGYALIVTARFIHCSPFSHPFSVTQNNGIMQTYNDK